LGEFIMDIKNLLEAKPCPFCAHDPSVRGFQGRLWVKCFHGHCPASEFPEIQMADWNNRPMTIKKYGTEELMEIRLRCSKKSARFSFEHGLTSMEMSLAHDWLILTSQLARHGIILKPWYNEKPDDDRDPLDTPYDYGYDGDG
jgi:hypothetical protein